MVEPRTNVDIMRDLLDAVREREWVEVTVYYRGDPEGTKKECGDRYCMGDGIHDPGCSIAALIAETEALLRVEDALEEERERATKGHTS